MTKDFQLSMKDLQLSVTLREATSIYDLLDDNLGEIFSKLPVRSVLSCQCVCKRFSKVIACPKFKDLHVNRAITSNTTSFCSVFLCGKDETEECDSDELVRFRYDHILLKNSHNSLSCSYVRLSNPISCDISIVGSCNGLMCAKLEPPEDQNESYMLIWNPVTRENRYVAKPRVDASRVYILALSFGFTPGANDYKVVRIISNYSIGEPLQHPDDVVVIKQEVYNMSTDNWSSCEIKTLQCCETDHMPPEVDPIILLSMSGDLNSRSLRGAFHWLADAPRDASRTAQAIVSFGLQDEQLRLFTVLDSNDIPGVENGMLDCLNDLLSIIVPHYLSPYACFDIWVMNTYGDRKSWIKQFTVNQFRGLAAQPIGYWKNDIFLMGKLIMDNKFLCFYNLRNKEMKFFPVTWQLYTATGCDYTETFERVGQAIATTGEAVQ